ncbi:hypothetical protein [Cellulomonas sp. JZ18]|uniref:hypothetical protein n=1 Tax=Cellulomonas sp. JZ18 TaxID=2654191 RepID=UPI001E4CAA35|nr:hypothetical protein [Cellulomonas sp. JZ18]
MSLEPQTPLPSAKDVRDLLENLLGREVVVTTGGDMVDPEAPGGALVGLFVDRLLHLRAMILMDLALAAYVGAAIGLVPRPAAEDAAAGGLSPNLEENAREVINVASSLLNGPDVPHVRLDSVYAPGEPLPADVVPWVKAYVRRTDLRVEVSGYGRGGWSLLVL